MKTIRTRESQGVAYLQFDRAEVRNAISRTTMNELELVLTKWSRDPNVKVVVLSGDQRAFASGGDLQDLHVLQSREEIYPVMERMGQTLRLLEEMPALTIAAVEGVAVGGGCEIVASCDWCIAAPTARFGMIQERLGITTGWGGAGRLMKKIGQKKAEYLLLSGEIIDAQTAFQMGLVERILPKENWWTSIEQLATKIAGHPDLIRKTYQQIGDLQSKQKRFDSHRLEADRCAVLWERPEHHQAVEQFLFSKKERK
ncbi:enoyl-CoA hydratase/isomerase family protein [Risungbinella massiliensis]|uniref:enoyl-CoA hydratase/isomerase family protein n=1 Tax=Risungbinella massiliensis TaxID=1329796 RepID=UPI0005CC89A9|nr:enoyl-CoA hydratase/isomerase family protein [Risungbinella massiliensis]